MKKFILLLVVVAIACKAGAQDNYQRTTKGTQYKILTHIAGDKIQVNNVVTFNAIQKTGKDSILFSTYNAGAPMQAQVTPNGDLMDIFPLLTAGDSVIIRVPTDTIFKNNEAQRPPFLPKGSNMFFILKIERVQTFEQAMYERKAKMESMQVEEAAGLKKYIAAHKLLLKTTPSGLEYKITKPSVKRKPLPGDTVLVNYTGSTLDGKVFDSSVQAEAVKGGLNQPGREYKPLQFVLGNGEVIPGWDEGIQLLNEGSKAMFVIPSKLAYAEKSAGEDIKPFSTLIFTVELVKVKPIKHAAKPVAKKPVVKSAGAVKKKS